MEQPPNALTCVNGLASMSEVGCPAPWRRESVCDQEVSSRWPEGIAFARSERDALTLSPWLPCRGLLANYP